MFSSSLKAVVCSLPTGTEPNDCKPRSAPSSLPMLKLNTTVVQLTCNGKELLQQETTTTAVSRRELIGLAATTLGGLGLFAEEPAEALEVADIGSSINELFEFFKGKPKTGADNEKKPKSDSDVKKPKVEDNGKKPKSETDDKKPKLEGPGNKPKSETDDKKLKVESHGYKPTAEVDEKKPKDGESKKALTPHHSEKDKVSSSSAAPTLPNILNNTVS